MIIEFEYTDTIDGGISPCVLHMPDNTFSIFYLDESANVVCKRTKPALGLYDNLTWEQKGRMSPDENISHMKLKKVAHFGAYGYLSSNTIRKFIMYMLPTDISNALNDGSISYTKDSAVSSASLAFHNINGALLTRNNSLVSPNAKLELYFSFGNNSDELPLGKWYIDSVSTSIPQNTISVTARNAIGKLLKEQSFDEHNTYTQDTMTENLTEILEYAGVEDYFVGSASTPWHLSFEKDSSILSGIEDIIRLYGDWKISETSSGRVGIGNIADERFESPGVFHFERDKSCYGYSTQYSDEQTYSRVCVTCNNPENSLYLDLPPHKLWKMPQHRTLYVKVPDGTTYEQLSSYAESIAQSVAISGRTETFAAFFTPQMIIGDEIEADGETLGTVTSIKHTLGKKGFFTEFTVDSSGRRGKPMLKDYITKISDNRKSDSIIST